MASRIVFVICSSRPLSDSYFAKLYVDYMYKLSGFRSIAENHCHNRFVNETESVK